MDTSPEQGYRKSPPPHECDAEYLYVLPGGLGSPGCLGYCASLGGSSVTLALTAHAAHPGGLNPKHFVDASIPVEAKEIPLLVLWSDRVHLDGSISS